LADPGAETTMASDLVLVDAGSLCRRQWLGVVEHRLAVVEVGLCGPPAKVGLTPVQDGAGMYCGLGSLYDERAGI